MRKVLLFLLILWLIPLNVCAADLSSGNISVVDDYGISTLAYGMDGYRSYTDITTALANANAFQFYVSAHNYTLYLSYDTTVRSWNVAGSSNVTSSWYTQSGSQFMELCVPLFYTNEINPYDSLHQSYTGLFIIPGFSSSVSIRFPSSAVAHGYSSCYIDSYTVDYTGVNGSGTYRFQNGGSNMRFHIPSDRGSFSVYANVIIDVSSVASVLNTENASYTPFFLDVSLSVTSFSIYGYVNIPPGDYSNVVNLENIASNTLTSANRLTNIYSRVGNIQNELKAFEAANHTDLQSVIDNTALTATRVQNVYTQLNNVNSNLLAFQTANHNDLQSVLDSVKTFDTNNDTRITALNKRIITETSRLINAFLHETEYPDGDAGAGKLEDAYGEYDKAETDVTNKAFDWIGGFDPGSLIDFSGNIATGIAQFNTFFTSLLAAMGYYEYVLFIGIGLVFLAILIGVLRFRG